MVRVEMRETFAGIYKEKKVLITGITGFKGSWLALWLYKMNARVIGFSLDDANEESHYTLLNLPVETVFGDIRNASEIQKCVAEYKPDIIFHLAAQSLVRKSYEDPALTYQTNVMGTLNVLEAARNCKSVKAVVNVTTDKVYENVELEYAYNEEDKLGGYDPYSSSKACSEILTSSYRRSFFNNNALLLASARSGNVIGGGDWAADRLIPDIIRAVQKDEPVIIRNPHALRPWQHVLEALSGYLMLGQKLLEGNIACADSWNLGPLNTQNLKVLDILKMINVYDKRIKFEIQSDTNVLHEAGLLMLNTQKADKFLGWRSIWNIEQTIATTIRWYNRYMDQRKINSEQDIEEYIKDAHKQNLSWAL